MLCFTEANRDGRYDQLIKQADAFVQGDPVGRRRKARTGRTRPTAAPATASTSGRTCRTRSFLIDALRAAGNARGQRGDAAGLGFRLPLPEPGDRAQHDAVRRQESGRRLLLHAGRRRASMAGETADGGLRSYGSMTYAGLKSMIYAGVGPDDPRVKAAVEVDPQHYDLAANPGMGDAGLYYYYHTFAKALDAIGEDQFVDEQGQARLAQELTLSWSRASGPTVRGSTKTRGGWRAIRIWSPATCC